MALVWQNVDGAAAEHLTRDNTPVGSTLPEEALLVALSLLS